MSWIFLAFGSILFFTTLNLLQRVIATDSQHPRAMAIIFNACAAGIALVIFLVTGSFREFSLPHAPYAWVALMIATFCYGMFERGRFIAAKLLDASVLITVQNISVVVAFIGALVLYNESMTVSKILGSILIVSALFLVSFSKHARSSSRKGLLVAVAISIMLGFGWMLDKMGSLYFNPTTYNVLVWVIPILFLYFPVYKRQIFMAEIRQASWKIVVLAVLNVLGYLMQLKALETADATQVIPVVQTSILFTVLLGIFLLKEHEGIPKKILAAVLAVVGTYFLM